MSSSNNDDEYDQFDRAELTPDEIEANTRALGCCRHITLRSTGKKARCNSSVGLVKLKLHYFCENCICENCGNEPKRPFSNIGETCEKEAAWALSGITPEMIYEQAFREAGLSAAALFTRPVLRVANRNLKIADRTSDLKEKLDTIDYVNSDEVRRELSRDLASVFKRSRVIHHPAKPAKPSTIKPSASGGGVTSTGAVPITVIAPTHGTDGFPYNDVPEQVAGGQSSNTIGSNPDDNNSNSGETSDSTGSDLADVLAQSKLNQEQMRGAENSADEYERVANQN